MDNKELYVEALYRMKLLNLDEMLVINPFRKGKIKVSERINDLLPAVLYDVDNYDILADKIKEFESKHNTVVYHVQLSHMYFGDCYSLFYVSSEKEEWSMDRECIKNGYPMTYTWNKDIPLYSEFGSIGIRCSMGGVERIS